MKTVRIFAPILAVILLLSPIFSGSAQEKKLPSVYIETEDQVEILSRDEYINCTVSLERDDDFGCKAAQIRVRGNTSAFNGDVELIRENQVPYKIKFSEKTEFLGLNSGHKFKSWVLLVADYNLVHTATVFSLGRAMGSFFSPDATLAAVYINGDYAGLYLVCDQKQVKKHRVEISEPEEGYTGTDIGYWVEIDHYGIKGSSFIMRYDKRAELTDITGVTRSPVKARYSLKSDFYSEQQLDFIEKYINAVYCVLRRACQTGEYYSIDEEAQLTPCEGNSAKEVIEKIFDLEAAADMYILQEMSRNGDVGKGSFYMCVDFAPGATVTRLTFTTPWDFTMVVDQGVEGFQAGAFFNEKFVMDNGDNSNPWFVLLLGQDWFRAMVKERLVQLREEGIIDEVFTAQREYVKTHRSSILQYDPSGWRIDGPDGAFEELDWMRKRLDWLEGVL